ncbi:MAG: carbohydrate ABC transporter permease [Planctomycetota bacterium]|jgi:multiple sugar transport system permease protein|nr:carbohydrate ABC transporter permease [Planctomycetota bacterium]
MSREDGCGKIVSWARGILIALISLAFLFPFLCMLLVSLRSRVDAIQPERIFTAPLTLDNYRLAIGGDLGSYFVNSVAVALFTTLASLILGSLAAYGFARYQWEKREDRAFWILSQKFLPAMAVVIPYFLMASLFNLLDTRVLLVICYTAFNIPFTIWMMRGFIEDLPAELEEAAFMDGCTRLQTIRRIVLPLVLPGMTATAIFCVINSWNEFVFANFLTSIHAKTVPTSVMMYLSISGVKWGEMAATGVLAVLPVFAFAIGVQKYMIRGLTFGAVKG